MDWIWSPWRFRYVSQASPKDACIFCAMAAESRDEEHLILHRGLYNFIVLNRFPYTTAHLMIVPYVHVPTLGEIDEPAAVELMRFTRRAEANLRATYHPHGLNLGMNLGESAGAGVAGHIHMHVLPRWHGDVSFMTSIGETRIIPEELGDTLRKLKSLPW
jgi:ATP adenylyltransferase